MDEEKVIDKIRKILELAERGATQAECDTAMAQAQKLLDKYNISMASVNRHKSAGDKYIRGDYIPANDKASLLERASCAIISKFCNIAFIVHSHNTFQGRRRDIVAYGQKHNVEIASYMQPWLMNEFDRRWQHYKVDNNLKGAKYRNTFIYGMWTGLDKKIEQQRLETAKEYSGSKDLAVLNETDQILRWIESQMALKKSPTKIVNVKDNKIAHDGFNTGRDINLSPQIGE